jgi:hypothetical protein
MNAVTIYLLGAKSWQILALVIGLCVLGQIVAAISLIRSMESTDELLNIPLCTDAVLALSLVLVHRCLPELKSAVRTQAEVWFLSIRARVCRNIRAVFYPGV